MTPSIPTARHTDLISLRAVAVRLDLSLRAVYRLIARGILPRPVKVGGASKLFERDIQQYFAALEAQRAPRGLPVSGKSND